MEEGRPSVRAAVDISGAQKHGEFLDVRSEPLLVCSSQADHQTPNSPPATSSFTGVRDSGM